MCRALRPAAARRIRTLLETVIQCSRNCLCLWSNEAGKDPRDASGALQRTLDSVMFCSCRRGTEFGAKPVTGQGQGRRPPVQIKASVNAFGGTLPLALPQVRLRVWHLRVRLNFRLCRGILLWSRKSRLGALLLSQQAFRHSLCSWSTRARSKDNCAPQCSKQRRNSGSCSSCSLQCPWKHTPDPHHTTFIDGIYS